jgi:hypothetical protein
VRLGTGATSPNHGVGKQEPADSLTIQYYPRALVSRVWHFRHGLCAIQTIALQISSRGARLWINAPRQNEEVVIAEGLETLLSAMLIFKAQVRSRCSGRGFMASLGVFTLSSKRDIVQIAAVSQLVIRNSLSRVTATVDGVYEEIETREGT